ncbi:MAG: hypothetical protein IK015_02300 [Treponema sp.]|nr:hypothetical protein [Treponema sp.]
MSNAFKTFAAAVILATFWSCAFMSFEELETDVSLLEKDAYYSKESVKIDFSISMERTSVENLVSLKEDGQRIDAKIEWNNGSCILSAKGGFKKGRKYTLSVKGDAFASDGRKYEVNIYREFVFGSQADNFLLNKFEEQKNARGDVESLAFFFNKPVDAAIFEREFSLSPYVETKKTYSTDFCLVEIFPSDKWKANSYYTWKIGNAFSQDGAKIFKDYQGSFLAARKEKAPQLLTACPAVGDTFLESLSLNDLLENQCIGLVFDCAMNKDSVERGVCFEPSVQGFWRTVDEKRFVFTPYNNYQIQKKYRLCVSDSVEDAWGINFKGEKNIFFALKSDFIDIEKITVDTNEICAGAENQLEIDYGSPLYIKIYFSKNLCQKSLLEIKNAVKFECLFPMSALNPRLNSILTSSSNCAEFCYSNLSAALDGQECLYKLTVKGGENFIFDAQGEYLKEDKCYYISLKKKD